MSDPPLTDEFPDRMAASDSLMWRIERDPLLCSNITAVSVLDRSPDHGALQERLTRMAQTVPRLRQRVVSSFAGLGAPRWEVDSGFDLAHHLTRRDLAPAALATALDVAAEGAMAPFDRERPLWTIEVLDGLDGGRAALVQRIHHSVADGIAGLRIVAELLDLEREPPPAATPAGAPGQQAGGGHSVAAAFASAARAGLSVPATVARTAARAVRSPVTAAGDLVDRVHWTARLVAPARAPLSPLLRGRGTDRCFRAFDVDLANLRAAAQAGGGKLNDAYLAAVLGGLARYHDAHGTPVDALRVTLPISIRKPSDPVGTNRVTLVRFAAPIAPDPLERVRRLNELTSEWRNGPAPAITDVLSNGLSALPAPLATAIFGQLLKSVDVVATNVPGAPVPVYLAGAEVLAFYAFAPTIGAALNVALISHVDRCCIGLNIDLAAVPDPELLVRCVAGGFDEILAAGGTGTV